MKKLFFAAALVCAVSVAKAQAPADAIYGVKSGIITMSMDMMGQEIVTETYFDDYGKKTAQVSDFGGQKSRTITVDGAQVRIDDAAKTATKMPSFGGMMGGGMGRPQINWNKLTDQVKKENNIKELGKETIAGKECTKYSMTMDMMGNQMVQNIWIYKGITLKTAMDSDMGSFGQTATKFQENVEIKADMFTVPAGVKIEEMDMSQFGGFGGF